MKILITGAAGFIGFHLTTNLLKTGHEVIGIDNMNSYYAVQLKIDRLKECGILENELAYNRATLSKKYQGYSFYLMDIKDKENILALFQKYTFDIVVNLAAQAGVRYSIENPYTYIDNNIIGFLNILEACKDFPPKKLIYASSSSVYGTNTIQPFSTTHKVDSPVSMYAVSKKANELMAHTYSNLYGFQTIGLRFFTVYGPWGRPDMAPFIFANAITQNSKLRVYNHGNMKRDFTYIDDIVENIKALFDKMFDSPYQILNIGNNKPVSLLYFIECLEESFGKKAIKDFMEMQPGDLVETWADIDDLMKITGLLPKVKIEEGVERFANWFKSYYK
jgi:UDP-glucuronate 4-epimerase